MSPVRFALRRFLGGPVIVALILSAEPVAAQTDYYNTDTGRPLQIEDAYPLERRAFEIQAAPLRLERARGGLYQWGIEPELAFGVLPRTQIELGAPLAFIDGGPGAQRSGLAGLDLSALHNLNVETAIPALAIGASVLLPVGSLGPDEAYASVKGLMTRTFTWARFHVNGEYTFGSERQSVGTVALARWTAGIAVDRTFPLRSLLIGGEVFAQQPFEATEDIEWNAGAGLRYQLSPRLALDGGVGRRLTGEERTWYLTFGAAYAFGLPWSR